MCARGLAVVVAWALITVSQGRVIAGAKTVAWALTIVSIAV